MQRGKGDDMKGRHSLIWSAMRVLLIFSIVVSAATAAGRQETEPTEEPELVWVHHYLGSTQDPEALEAWTDRLYELSGIRVRVLNIGDTDYNARVAAMLAAGEQIDLVYLDWHRYDALVENDPGLFVPLDDRIAASEVFSDEERFPPEIWEDLRKDDGHLYGTRIGAGGLFASGTVPIVRWDWVEQLGFAEKFENNRNLTLDDYYELLEAFATQDPDGNGRDDTYGFAMGYTLYESQPFFGTVGAVRLYGRDENGEIYIPYAMPETVPVWNFMHRLYENGILEPNFVTNKSSNFTDLFMSDKVGMIAYWTNWVHQLNDRVHEERPDSTFEARALWPPVGPDGTATLRTGRPAFDAIPVTSEYPDLAFQLMEFFQTEEGALLGTAGVEGFDYVWEDGEMVFTEAGRAAGQNHGIFPSWSWTPPWDIPSEWLEANEIAAALTVPQETYGRSGDQWEEVSGIDGAKILRGEVTVQQGLSDMRDRFLEMGLIDY